MDVFVKSYRFFCRFCKESCIYSPYLCGVKNKNAYSMKRSIITWQMFLQRTSIVLIMACLLLLLSVLVYKIAGHF